MITIILSASTRCREDALKAGFTEETVLVRHESVFGDACEQEQQKQKIEGEIMRKLQPYQFVVTNYWGAGPE